MYIIIDTMGIWGDTPLWAFVSFSFRAKPTEKYEEEEEEVDVVDRRRPIDGYF